MCHNSCSTLTWIFCWHAPESASCRAAARERKAKELEGLAATLQALEEDNTGLRRALHHREAQVSQLRAELAAAQLLRPGGLRPALPSAPPARQLHAGLGQPLGSHDQPLEQLGQQRSVSLTSGQTLRRSLGILGQPDSCPDRRLLGSSSSLSSAQTAFLQSLPSSGPPGEAAPGVVHGVDGQFLRLARLASIPSFTSPPPPAALLCSPKQVAGFPAGQLLRTRSSSWPPMPDCLAGQVPRLQPGSSRDHRSPTGQVSRLLSGVPGGPPGPAGQLLRERSSTYLPPPWQQAPAHAGMLRAAANLQSWRAVAATAALPPQPPPLPASIDHDDLDLLPFWPEEL